MENILKIEDDYYLNLEDTNQYHLSILKKFSYRPALPLRKMGLPFTKINQEQIEDFFIESNNYDIYWDYFPFSNNLHVQQNFINMAIFIPSVLQPESYKNNNNILKVLNSNNFMDCYKKIIKLAGQDENKLILVSTKRYYVPENYTHKVFDIEKAKYGYYIVPHINIYADYANLEGKFLCELTGTMIS